MNPAPVKDVQLAPMTFRAMVRSVNVEGRTVELIMSTGAKVLREGWDGPFYEELSLEKKHVRMKRLNNGAPLLDSHGTGWGGPTLEDQIGVVESAVLEEGKAIVGTVRFARAEDDPKAGQAFRKVADGIIRNVSIGYRTYRIEKVEGGEGTIPVFRATDWEPYETSLVPMGADDGAKVRGEEAQRNTCHVVTEIATRAAAPAPVKPPTKETRMKDATRSEIIDENPPDPAAAPPAAPATPDERAIGEAAELERIDGIRNACLAARLPRSFEDKLIRSTPRLTLVKAQGLVLDELRKRGGDDVGPSRAPSGVAVTGDGPLVHERAGIENAILNRVAPEFFKLEDIGRKYRGMTMLDIGRTYLNARGIRTTDLSKLELASLALGLTTRGGMHTTSDFPILLENVARKTLRAAYEEAEQTFKSIGRQVSLSDFKPSNRMQLGDAPPLLKVLEHGEFTRGTMTEGKEVLQLETYGRVFAITRQALINDDTAAFSRVPTAFGRSARTLESDLVWAEITSNPVMGDGVVLFHATHGNLDAVASVISVASLAKGRAAMRVQKSIDGITPLNVVPKYLATPAILETTAATFLTQITPALAGSVNPFAGLLSPLVEPRLDANSVTAWYLFAGPGFDIIEYAYLEGENGPAVDTRIGFDIDGMEIKCRLDFDAKVIDWRGVWKNPGV